MPSINANNIEIAYELHGSGDGPVMLLIMGLGMPSTGWPPRLIELLTDAGYRVLTFDNRDIGRSQMLNELRTPRMAMQALRHVLRLPVKSPYQLADMAADTSELLAALDIEEAHVVGASMGGMIAQLCAINHHPRVLSLTSVMSTTGDRDLPGPDWRVRQWYLRPMADKPEDQVTYRRSNLVSEF